MTKAMDEEGAWLGTVNAASDINVRSEAAARLSRRLADMHDHIAALEADNAALLDAMGEVSTTLEAKELRHYGPDDANLASKQRRIIDTAWAGAREAYGARRRGDALLGAHRKALEPEHQSTRTMLAKLREVLSEHGAGWTGDGFAGVLNGIERVVLLARNEGLEKAAQSCEVASQGCGTDEKVALRWQAKDIRAMKEPVSDSSEKVTE